MDDYITPAQGHSAQLEIKRSRFIALVDSAKDREQALQFLQHVRQQHPQARHVCWAYIAGSPQTTVRSMSDDGEPSGTAGRPMLSVLEHSAMGEVVVAVVRYFGGIKLGTGGLQRAYSDAVSLVLADCPVQTRKHLSAVLVECDFAVEAAVRRLVVQFEGQVSDANYGQAVRLSVSIAAQHKASFSTALASATAGGARCWWD